MFQWDLCQVLLSEADKNGFLGIGYDLYGGKAAGADLLELHSTYGFRSRPLDPDVDPNGTPKPGAACGVWICYEGNKGHAMLASDPRITQIVPTLEKGESLLYGPKGNFVRCHADGSVSVQTTTDGTVTGQTIQLRLAPDGFTMAAPWGKIVSDVNGIRLQDHSGAKISLGGIGGMPSPLDAAANRMTLAAAMMKIEATLLAIGPAGPKEGVVKGASLVALLGLFVSAIQAVSTLAGAATPTGASAAAATAATSAIAALTGAMSTALDAIASKCATVA